MNDSQVTPEKSVAEAPPEASKAADWRFRWHEIIFEADTPKGKAFDIGLLVTIVASILIVMLQSVTTINQEYGKILIIADWVITIGFSIEYALRIACVRRPWRYIFSFWGIVDLLSVLPSYVALVIPGSHYLSVVRVLRLLVGDINVLQSDRRIGSSAVRFSARTLVVGELGGTFAAIEDVPQSSGNIEGSPDVQVLRLIPYHVRAIGDTKLRPLADELRDALR